MRVLLKLLLTRFIASIRHQFSRLSSALFTIFIILFYGGLIILCLWSGDITLSMMNLTDVNMSIMIGIGMTAMMVAIMLLQKKKAMFMEPDAFYLFSGPFTRRQMMLYLIIQNLSGAAVCGALSILMIVFLGGSIQFTFMFMLLAFLCFFLVYVFFLTIYYYLYLLTIQDKKYRHIPMIVSAIYVIFVLIIYGIAYMESGGSLQLSGMYFLNSELFYWVPFFGWVKWILVSYVAGNWLYVGIGFTLLLLSCVIVTICLCQYKGDFVEKAMEDAIEFTKLYKEVRAGKKSQMGEKKIHDVKHTFYSGAMAIYSKNVLLMRKSNDYIRWTDIFTLGLYLIITLLLDLGFGFFIYMMMFWLFSVVQNADFMKDMNNYQIYLIPDHPLKKMISVILPTFLKMIVPMVLALALSAVLYQSDMMTALQYGIMLLGYALLFISATVLSLRILKSRNNAMMENMLRMMIVVVAAIPSIALIIYFISKDTFTFATLQQMTLLSLVMNIVISIVIILICAPMMNGREIKSE